jgi:hypothetical protein
MVRDERVPQTVSEEDLRKLFDQDDEIVSISKSLRDFQHSPESEERIQLQRQLKNRKVSLRKQALAKLKSE